MLIFEVIQPKRIKSPTCLSVTLIIVSALQSTQSVIRQGRSRHFAQKAMLRKSRASRELTQRHLTKPAGYSPMSGGGGASRCGPTRSAKVFKISAESELPQVRGYLIIAFQDLHVSKLDSEWQEDVRRGVRTHTITYISWWVAEDGLIFLGCS